MRLPRFKIRSLLGVVVFVGIAVAALRAADEARDSGVFGLTLLILLTAVLLAVRRTDRRRAFFSSRTSFVILDGKRWFLWYNGRRGGVEQIGLATHDGEDPGF